jgi:hypothetical protein
MRVAVIVKTMDQVPGAGTVDGPQLTFPHGQVTAREIVRSRVQAEVDLYNSADVPRTYVGLVTPGRDEVQLNSPRLQRRRTLDVEAQIAVALEAVRAGRVIIMFNGLQIDDLDQPLFITPVSEARFLKLVPLVGG